MEITKQEADILLDALIYVDLDRGLDDEEWKIVSKLRDFLNEGTDF